jgi:hypothetical protein
MHNEFGCHDLGTFSHSAMVLFMSSKLPIVFIVQFLILKTVQKWQKLGVLIVVYLSLTVSMQTLPDTAFMTIPLSSW